jgi:hypothetical protein
MGSRDYSHREKKKTRKEAKKLPPVITIITPPAEVEVIRKGKKREPDEEE